MIIIYISTRIERSSKSHNENFEIPTITNEYISTENDLPKLTKNKRKKQPIVIFSSSDEEKKVGLVMEIFFDIYILDFFFRIFREFLTLNRSHKKII